MPAVLDHPEAAIAATLSELTWPQRFAARALGVKSSMIRELLKLTERPEIISFAGGLPAVTLPPGSDSIELFARALEENVAFIPGAPFYANGGGARSLRLNFSYCTPQKIEEGVARLGRLLRGSGLGSA